MLRQDGLYYPYMTFSSVNWLKANLLLFRRVYRMVSDHYVDEDKEYLTFFEGRDTSFVQNIAPASEEFRHGFEIFNKKLNNLSNDRPDLFHKLRISYLEEQNISNRSLIHPDKFFAELMPIIWMEELAEESSNPCRVHPAFGEALMSCFAISCAEHNGTKILTSDGIVHNALKDLDAERAFDAIMYDEDYLTTGKRRAQVTSLTEEAVSLYLFANADLSKIGPAELEKLSNEREAISDLMDRIREMSSNIPDMANRDKQIGYMKDVADQALREWRKDVGTMSNFWRAFFGDSFGKRTEDFFSKFGNELAAGVVGGLSVSAAAGSALLATGAGIGIGLVAHTASSYGSAINRTRSSSYRFLSLLEREGIVFSVSGGD